VYELRKHDAGFAAAWEEAEERAADALEAEAWRRAVDGVQEPLVAAARSCGTMTGNRSRSDDTPMP
jgi:hypothetical protein